MTIRLDDGQAEADRLAALRRYNVLDTVAEEQFDEIVKLAADICGAPISLISLIDEDRQWFKARVGLEVSYTARDVSACQYAILQPDLTIITDTHQDARFIGNPLVTGDPHMRFYAGAPLHTPAGHRIGTLCILDTKPRDLTALQANALRTLSRQVVTLLELRLTLREKEERETQLVEISRIADDANRAKREFLANMSHEIRTPMNAIIGLSSLLSMSGPLTEKQGRFIETLRVSADSLLELINDLLDISKIEARSMELEAIPFDLTRIVEDVAGMMAVRVREKGLGFTCESACTDGRSFIGDPTRVRQIVLNLCSNAVKFTEQGEVRIAITCQPHEADPSQEMVSIAVSDTGIGIAPEKLTAIFQKFSQGDNSVNRKYGGTGLGLAITKTLSEIMGGTVRVESCEGEGSTFTVRLPLRPAVTVEAAIRTEPAIMVPEARPAARILLVEDHEPNVLVALAFLQSFGFEADVASNGFEAYERVKTGRYAAVVMDVQMHGMNGLEATRLIRSWQARTGAAHLPIIGMTAHALSGDRERCLEAGMDEYISKPFNPRQFEALLMQATRA